MTQTPSRNAIILGIAPSSRGFGFAVFETPGTLIHLGGKDVNGDKNAQSLAKISELISHYRPDCVVIEDTTNERSRRSDRVKELHRQIVSMAEKPRTKVTQLSRKQLQKFFSVHGVSTKHEVAELLAHRFPEDLASRLPPKRKAWMSQNYQMAVFDAVALCVVASEFEHSLDA